MLDMGSVQELEAQLRGLKQRQAEISAEIERSQKKAKVATGFHLTAVALHKAGVEEVRPNLGQAVMTQLCLLLELAGSCAEIPVSFALGQGRPKHCRGHGFNIWDADVRRYISAGIGLLYLGMAYESVVELMDANSGHMISLCRYVVEYKLYHWLLEMNCEKGVSPGVSDFLAQAVKFLPTNASQAASEHLQAFFTTPGRSARSWVASFKQRWGVKQGVLSAGEDLEAGQLQSKVPEFG